MNFTYKLWQFILKECETTKCCCSRNTYGSRTKWNKLITKIDENDNDGGDCDDDDDGEVTMSTAQNSPNCYWSRVSCAHTTWKTVILVFVVIVAVAVSFSHSFIRKQVRHCTNSIMVERSWHTGRVWTPKVTHVMGTLTTVLQRYELFFFFFFLFDIFAC